MFSVLNPKVPQMVKNLPAMQETWVRSLGQEDPLGKGMATHINILAWEIPWTEEPGGLQSMGLQRVGYNLVMKQQLVHYIRNSLCCLENNTEISQPFAIENNT